MAEGAISGNSFYDRAVGFNNLNLVRFHPSFHELHRVARELCKSDFSKLKSKLREVNPSIHCTESFIFAAEANGMSLASSGLPRRDTLRPGEGKRRTESDGRVASGASVESSGGMMMG